MILDLPRDRLGNFFSLHQIAAGAASIIKAARRPNQRQSKLCRLHERARWQKKAPGITFLVGERDKRRMAAAVMPSEHALWHAAAARECQNAFVVARTRSVYVRNFAVFFIAASADSFEKIGRRKLLVVADHNDLLRPRHDSKR